MAKKVKKRIETKEHKPEESVSDLKVRFHVKNVFTGQMIQADLDFGAFKIEEGCSDFEGKKREFLQIHASAAYLYSLAQAWSRQARKDALEYLEATGVTSIGAKEQGVKQNQEYVDAQNAEDVLGNLLDKVLEWNLRLLQSSNANDRQERSY